MAARGVGRPQRGLQLGARAISFSSFQIEGVDGVSYFSIVVRNVGKKPVSLTYSKDATLWVPVIAEREDKKPLDFYQLAALAIRPSYSGQPWGDVTATLQPWRMQPIALAHLHIGPIYGGSSSGPTLWSPGRYKLTYAFAFKSSDLDESGVPHWALTLKAAPVPFEITPAAPETNSNPKPQ